jgi:NTE family protein
MPSGLVPVPVGLDQRDEPTRTPFPCGASVEPEEFGLALSGGGYRATLFHLGALWRLNEFGWLSKLDRISTVSGGSLIAGILATGWPGLHWDGQGRAENFAAVIERPTLRLASRPIDAFIIGLGLIPLVNPATLMDWVLHVLLTKRKRLPSVPDRPRFVFNAASLASGESWRFEKPYMGDSRIGVVCAPDVRLSTAIAASAAYPPFVAPLVLDLSHEKVEYADGADLFQNAAYPELMQRVLLLDGGAYDNLGVEAVEGRCRIVLASDAGGNLAVDQGRFWYRFWWPLVKRTLDLAVEGGRRQRRRALIDRATTTRQLRDAGLATESVTERAVIWRTALQIGNHPLLPQGWTVDPGWAPYIATRSTRMWPMSPYDRKHVVNWGYLTADLMIRQWAADLPRFDAPTRLPYEDAPFDQPPL